ncbi:MAG: arginine N-succinyltransferase [Candidatus Omnitrophica bacterium]|nr:arginine N-succinyltransferase [Candidatus Omnitrophota bacterium]
MFLIRSARLRDLKAVLGLAKHLDSYNLPADRKHLARLLEESETSFRGAAEENRRKFLFVAEDLRTRKIVGSSLIIARHGTPRLPHLSFEMGLETKKSVSLGKRISHTTLKLHADKAGFTEIGGLVVLPRYRRLGERVGKQLSYARFAYMAGRPRAFRPRVLVEYLPRLDSQDGNELWKSLGQKFTRLSYHEADRLSVKTKEFILSLFPKEKIYACLLPDEAVRYLGTPGPGAEVSLRLLKPLGFRFLRQVDPFDGGPHYGASFKKISAIENTVFLNYKGTRSEEDLSSPPRLVMLERRFEVLAVVTPYRVEGHGFYLTASAARALGVEQGERLSATPFERRRDDGI